MIYITVTGKLSQLPLHPANPEDVLKQNTATVWNRVLESFGKNILPQPNGTVSYVTLVLNSPAPVRVTSTPVIMHPDDDVQFTFFLEGEADAFLRTLSKVQVLSLKTALNAALLNVTINCPSGIYMFTKLDFIPPTKLELLIQDAETKLANTHRVSMRTSMIADLKRLQADAKPEAEILATAADTLTTYGVYAKDDHANRSGWRWGGFVMGLFGARDKAPLMFSSAFKKTTDELVTTHTASNAKK